MAGETILIVEDRRENIVHLANNVLKPNGYQVITAMDGHRGLKRGLATLCLGGGEAVAMAIELDV